MAKSKKVEKETRRLIEGITDLVKKKGDRYKFKTKSKKTIKKIKKQCPHWIIRKGKECPTVIQDPAHPGYWKCTICDASFPIKPLHVDDQYNQYAETIDKALQVVNQLQFWSVKLGGDATDTKMFTSLKQNLPRLNKVSKAILKRVNRREEMDRNRTNTDAMSQFSSYAGYNYK